MSIWDFDCEVLLENGQRCGKDGYALKGAVFCYECWKKMIEEEGTDE